jgi:hypothetical protein
LKTNPCFSTLYKSNQPYWDLKWRRTATALDMVLVARTVKYEMTIRTRTRGGLTQLSSAWAARHDIVSYSITPL